MLFEVVGGIAGILNLCLRATSVTLLPYTSYLNCKTKCAINMQDNRSTEKMRRMMKRPEAKKFTIIQWHPVEERPSEGRYILIQYIDADGELACDWAAYEKGRFIYIYPHGAWGEINEKVILGWSYLPFDD